MNHAHNPDAVRRRRLLIWLHEQCHAVASAATRAADRLYDEATHFDGSKAAS